MSVCHFSKSRYCACIQCPKILWLREHLPEDEFDESVINQTVLDTGNDVGDLAMGLFGDFTEVPYSEHLSDMIPATQKLIDEGVKNICEASFAYNGCFCSVDILRNLGNKKVELYEVKSSTEVKWIYEHDISYQYYVLTKLGYTVKKACIVHINSEYVRHGKLELDKLFTIVDLTKTAKSNLQEVEKNIKKFRKYLKSETEPECEIGGQCSDPYKCGYFMHCAVDLPESDEPTVWDIAGLRTSEKQKLYEEGHITFKQLYDSDVLKGKYLQQVEVELLNLPPQIEKKQIKSFLKTLSFPIYFLDFETFNPAIPLYDNSRPYQQIVFQYSLHYIEKKGGKLKHKEYLAYSGSDPRRQIAEQLCADIPVDVCTTAYNMGFEKGKIRDLAELYPDLHDHLMNIHDNINDIMIPFQKRWYYTKEMQGSYSIKYVLPALFADEPSLNYENLEGVHNGQEASDTFLAMQKMNEKELAEWREHLLRYCELDTLAMVKVLEKLREAVK